MIFLGVEVVDRALECFTVFAGDLTMIGAAEFTVVAAANFAIAELGAQSGCDLEVRPHLENAIVEPARRGDLECFDEPRLMRVQISTRLFGRGPPAKILDRGRLRLLLVLTEPRVLLTEPRP